MGGVSCRLVMAAFFMGLLAARAEDQPLLEVSPSYGQLCISECDTCPLTCSSSPSPPAPFSPPSSLPSSPYFPYTTPPISPPVLPPPPPPSPLSYTYPRTPSTWLPPPSPDQSPIYPYPYYFFYSSAPLAIAVASRGLVLHVMFLVAAILLIL